MSLVGSALGRHPLLVGVSHDLGQVLRLFGVEHIKEVLPCRPLVGSKRVWKVRSNVLVLGKLGPECLDGQLIVVRDFDRIDLCLVKQTLLLNKD